MARTPENAVFCEYRRMHDLRLAGWAGAGDAPAHAGPHGLRGPVGRGAAAGAGDTLYRVDPDSAEITPVLRLALDAGVRFNDGKCDPEGRLWAGVMAVDRSRTDTAALGALYGIGPEGPFQRLAPMDIPNGMAWDASGAFTTPTLPPAASCGTAAGPTGASMTR